MWSFWRPLIANYDPNKGVDDPPGGFTNLCVDDPNWDATPGTQLQDQSCWATTAQQWLMPGNTTGSGTFPTVADDGAVDSGFSSECMDAYGSSDGAAPGQAVAINSCDGNQAQDWTVWSDGTVRAWGKCLDTNGGPQPYLGTPLVDLEVCDGAAGPGVGAAVGRGAGEQRVGDVPG